MSRSTKIGVIVSVICAIPAAVALLVVSEIRAYQSGQITVIDAA